MDRKADNEFQELELYLENAQEELLSHFADADSHIVADAGCLIVADGDIEVGGLQQLHYTHKTCEVVESLVDDKENFVDIINLYDNMEFYKEYPTIKTEGLHDRNNNTDSSRPTRTCEYKQSTALIVKQSSDPGIERKGKTVDIKTGSSESVSVKRKTTSVSVTCGNDKTPSPDSQVVGRTGSRNHADDLEHCKSENVMFSRPAYSGMSCSRFTDGESVTKLGQEVLHHLPDTGNQNLYDICGSSTEVIQKYAFSLSIADMQINGKQSSYHTGDKTELDNGNCDKEVEGGTLMSLQPCDMSIWENNGVLCNKSTPLTGNNEKVGNNNCHEECNCKAQGATVTDCDEIFRHQTVENCENKILQFGCKRATNTNTCQFKCDNLVSFDRQLDTEEPIKNDLQEFLDGINESIDELICERKGEMSDSEINKSGNNIFGEEKCEMSNSCFLGKSEFAICTKENSESALSGYVKNEMSDSGLSFLSKSDVSESCVSCRSIDSGVHSVHQKDADQKCEDLDNINDKGKAFRPTDVAIKSKSCDSITVNVDADTSCVVETDTGYYWLTCSFEEEHKSAVSTDWSLDQSLGSYLDRNCEIKHKDNAGKVDGLNDEDKQVIAEDIGFSDDETTHKTKALNNIHEESTEKDNSLSKLTNIKKRFDVKPKKNVNKLVLPNIGHDSLKPECKSDFIEDAGLSQREVKIRNMMKRKYSCPPNMFKVFKVVSVDIPKIDPTKLSKSHENIKRLSLKENSKKQDKSHFIKVDKTGENLKRHSFDCHDQLSGSTCSNSPIQETKDIGFKRHSLETLPSKQRTRHTNDDEMENLLDISGFKTMYDPPALFRDKPSETLTIGPILRPPPDFDTNVQVMDKQTPPPPVWDPGAPPGTSFRHSGDCILSEPSTPPPPSAHSTENIISKTLNKIHKPFTESNGKTSPVTTTEILHHNIDSNKIISSSIKTPKLVNPKKLDNVIRSDYVELDFYQNLDSGSKQNLQNGGKINSNTSNFCPGQGGDEHSKLPAIVSGNLKGIKCSTSERQANLDLSEEELSKMLDLIESYNKEDLVSCVNSENEIAAKDKECHKPKFSCAATNTTDSLDRRKITKTVVKDKCSDKPKITANLDQVVPVQTCNSEHDTGAIYATVDKGRPRKPTPEKEAVQSVSQVNPPPIPPKPKFLSEIVDCKRMVGKHEPSPEMQVMFNSLSPVLLRRNNSNRSHRKHGSSTETSPESTPDVSPREKNNDPDFKNKGTFNHKGPSESLFMDPEMAKTWHGTTSTDWAQYYGPQMRAMMKELNRLNGHDLSDSNDDDVNHSMDDFESKSKTLPSKSLLDEMHKKFCADQYMDEKDIAITRALVLFRLKSHPPSTSDSKAKRSQSLNIKMGTGATLSRKGVNKPKLSASTNSSPLFPRASQERLRIKTRADVQYSPRPGKTRVVTPEPKRIIEQAQNLQKEEAEIEAIEACRWLRETGFPQYAQLYEDGQFPVDIESVEKDHDFLDKEDIQSLFRRLNTLNKCAIMKIGTPTKKESEESDEEEQCALSDKWKYQRSSRRWSRKDLDCPSIENRNGHPALKSASSHDSLLAGQNSSSETGDSPVLDSKMLHTNDDMVFKTKTPMLDANGNKTTGESPRVIRRAASERIKGAKSFLKRMESLKGKRTRKNKAIMEISGPVVADKADMQAKIKHLNCKDISLAGDTSVPEVVKSVVKSDEDSNKNLCVSSPELTTVPRKEAPTVVTAPNRGVQPVVTASNREALTIVTSPRREALTVVTPPRRTDNSLTTHSVKSSALSSDISNKSLNISDDLLGFSTEGALGLDSLLSSRQSQSSDATNSSQETLFISGEYRPGKFPKLLDDSLFASDSNLRARSFSYADDTTAQEKKRTRRGSHDPRKQMNRVSIYDNVPVEEDLATAQQELDIILSELFQNINGLNKAINGENAELLEPPVSNSFFDDSTLSSDSQSPENELEHGDVIRHDESEVISGTLSSPDISDHEIPTEDMSHDDSAEHIVVRERRDSGVGSSLTRTNSERRKYRIRWHSFQKSHRPTSESRNLQLYNLSAGQILVLRKLSLLKLTALIEKYAPNRSGWSLTVPRFMKRNKNPDYKDKNVFGVPFSVIIQRTGQPLPQCILHAMRFLRRTGGEALGIFRKSGVRSRIQKLRNDIEADPESVDFEELQAYDVADLVKQYFRELPECLLTNKLSDIFISIFIYVPSELRLEAIQAAVVLMNDENRDVLQSLLLFLSDIAKCASKHQMTASNLAVCFAPSLFNMGGARNASLTPSPRRNRKNAPGIPDARELMEQKAGHECLTFMIQECKKLFTIPALTLSKCRVLYEDPVTLEELNRHSEDGNHGYTAHIDSCIQGLLKESREKFRGWVSSPVNIDVDVSYKKVGDGHPLRLWKCTVEVEAPPNEVLNRVLNDRQKWDEDLLQWNTLDKLDKQTEVFQYVRNSMAPHPTRDYCVLRSWRTDLPKGACVLISTSIDHENAELVGGIRGVELASRYLIEPCGTGKSRLTHISRVDMKGHSPEWYKKVYGHICANFMDRIRASFHTNSDGPETKV